MINISIVLTTAVALILASAAFNYIVIALDKADEVHTTKAIAGLIIVLLLVYLLTGLLHITLSVFLGILLAKFFMVWYASNSSNYPSV